MSSRRHNPRLVKMHRSYTVVEVAVLFGICRNTVRNWIKGGLEFVRHGKRILIPGRELRRYIENNNCSRKRKCGPGELFCLRCKTPREPLEAAAVMTMKTPSRGTLEALCATCGTKMYRHANIASMDDIRAVLQITIKVCEPHIRDQVDSPLNCDLNSVGENHA